MKNKWFWGTLSFWFIFAIAFTSRALIFSDVKFDPQIISHYEIKTNGLIQSHKLWINEGSLNNLLPLLSDRLRQEGWISCAGGRDIIPDLLQLDSSVPDISDKLQIKIYRKPGFHLSIGLLQREGETKTYGWESILPDMVFNQEQARKSWDLSFPTPSDAKQLVNEKLENLQIAMVILPLQKNLTGRFQELCQQGNWEAALWKKGETDPVFILTKGENKLLALLSHQDSEDVITLLRLDKRKDFYD